MRCKKHLADLSSGVGVCATCLRERLLELIAAQAQAQAQAQQAQLARFAIEDGLKHDPPPLIFPRSVSPYVSRRKSDDNSATWIHNQRFYSTPQVGPTYSTTSTSYFEATRSFKKKNRFSLFSNLLRSRSEKFNSDPRVHFHRDSCDEPSTSSASPSWFAAIFPVRRKKQQSSKTSRVDQFDQFGPGDRRSCRIIDRGMSPAIEVDSGDECDQPPSGASPEASPRWKMTPTAARRPRGGTRNNISGLAFCLSPLMRPSPNTHWNQKGGLPPDMSFSGEARPSTKKPHLASAAGFHANRSRKLADFGRVNRNR
ncbi:hypothetical protein E1A91_A08G065600v1 [Gossypium mustelinum]|uniref:Uncharacterized protein n=3 Tax=Gossypium TaxID=3633 RepID=A0A2P5X014_GOSBA|nr:hypothetical protein ES319_A08G061800v1 [Gossypium barbadense]PPR96667.1 hypothetical protein GOBAR_AA24001 [Gossypium barbadense]TYH05218.1 hypothetical protein ES288_A08G065900v1 [Gossypium darwinii]TYJ21452.1 hypothetical protein E1A91_A08G065600v1 [Gossypium mustelinum]